MASVFGWDREVRSKLRAYSYYAGDNMILIGII